MRKIHYSLTSLTFKPVKMKNSKILNFIGKGQITIPLEWRQLLELEKSGAVMSYMEGEKIIIEKIPLNDESDWDIENIELNKLSENDQKIIKSGREDYKKKNKEKFYSSEEFFS